MHSLNTYSVHTGDASRPSASRIDDERGRICRWVLSVCHLQVEAWLAAVFLIPKLQKARHCTPVIGPSSYGHWSIDCWLEPLPSPAWSRTTMSNTGVSWDNVDVEQVEEGVASYHTHLESQTYFPRPVQFSSAQASSCLDRHPCLHMHTPQEAPIFCLLGLDRSRYLAHQTVDLSGGRSGINSTVL